MTEYEQQMYDLLFISCLYRAAKTTYLLTKLFATHLGQSKPTFSIRLRRKKTQTTQTQTNPPKTPD